MKTTLITTIVLSCLHCNINGQTLLSGTVLDENNKALELATVAIYAKNDSSYVKACISDTLGKYKIALECGEYIIKCSRMGYMAHREDLVLNDQPLSKDIVLKNDAKSLSEVTVTASRNPFSFREDGLMVDVANSILKNEPRTMDLLAKIPGIVSRGNSLEVFGKGTPAYYINDRKVYDFSEVENLAVDDIQTIQLLTSPDARYSSDGRAVILIKTKKRHDGLALQLSASSAFRRKFNHNEGLVVHYQRKNLHLFGTYKYSDMHTRESGSYIRTINADTIWNMVNHNIEGTPVRQHFIQSGFDYDINKNHGLGLKYSATISDNATRKNSLTTVLADSVWFAALTSNSDIPYDYQSHHVNMYYRAKLNEIYTLSWYSDYIHKESEQRGMVTETDSGIGQSQTSYISRGLWNVWASNIQLGYNNTVLGRFVLGYKLSYVKGKSRIQYTNTLNSSQTENQEKKHSFFLTYRKTFGKLSLNAGLRYDSDFFPSLSLSHSTKEMQQSLSYSSSILRPNFDLLNNNVKYVNRFDYRKGNINLLPETTHEINYRLLYKFIYLYIGYAHIKNRISTTMYVEPGNSSVVIGTSENFKRHDALNGMVNLRHDFKWWTPSLSLSLMKDFFRYKNNDGSIIKSRWPVTTVFWYNEIKLPKDMLASANYTYCFGGDLMNIHVGSYSSLDLRLQKNFMKKKLSIYLEAYDVFKTDRNKGTVRLNNITLDAKVNFDQRRFGVSVIYRFNIKTKEYKGDSAAGDELKRLSIDE